MVLQLGEYINRTDKDGKRLHRGDSVRYIGTQSSDSKYRPRTGNVYYVIRLKGSDNSPQVLLTSNSPDHPNFADEHCMEGDPFKPSTNQVVRVTTWAERNALIAEAAAADATAPPVTPDRTRQNGNGPASPAGTNDNNSNGVYGGESPPPVLGLLPFGEELGPEYVYTSTDERIRMGDDAKWWSSAIAGYASGTVCYSASNRLVCLAPHSGGETQLVHVSELQRISQAVPSPQPPAYESTTTTTSVGGGSTGIERARVNGARDSKSGGSAPVLTGVGDSLVSEAGEVSAHLVQVECTAEQIESVVALLESFGCAARVLR